MNIHFSYIFIYTYKYIYKTDVSSTTFLLPSIYIMNYICYIFLFFCPDSFSIYSVFVQVMDQTAAIAVYSYILRAAASILML